MLNDLNNDDFPCAPVFDDEDDGDVSIAKIKSQMGFANDEHGTFLGLPKTEEIESTSESFNNWKLKYSINYLFFSDVIVILWCVCIESLSAQ